MNLLASETKLNLQQEKAIYELTLKKQRSKKSTISQKQVAAMQQLANELITQRKDSHQYLIDHNQNHLENHLHHDPSLTTPNNNNNIQKTEPQQQQQPQPQARSPNQQSSKTDAQCQRSPNQLCRCTKSTTSSSFISTTSTASSSASSARSDETNIKLSQLRLDQLNNELERRLHQYEYLVAQEKAILSAYKMNLFANESVNNFHLFHLDQKSNPYK